MRWQKAAGPLFLLTAWFAASFFLFGGLGCWSDDYAYTYRDPVSGASLLARDKVLLPHFWRPLYYLVVPPLQTWLVGNWVQHLISAVVHGLVCFGVYSLARRIGASRLASSVAFLVLCTFPAAWEASLWDSALPTLVSAGMLVLLFHVARWWTERSLVSWPAFSALVIGFAMPCWNEQAAAAVGAVVGWPGGGGGGGRRGAEVARRVFAGVVPCIGVAAYLMLYWLTAPNGARGTAGTFTTGATAVARLASFVEQFNFVFLQRGFRWSALRLGMACVLDHWTTAFPLGVAFVAFAVLWSQRSAREADELCAPDAGRRSPAIITGGLGLLVFGLAWLPVLAVRHQEVLSRLCYAPLVGAALVAAGLTDGFIRRAPAG